MTKMLTIASQIEIVQTKIENSQQLLDEAFSLLGKQIVKKSNDLNYIENEEFLNKVQSILKENKILNTSIEDVKKTIDNIQQNDKGITTISANLKNLENQFRQLLEMLGANVVEVNDSGFLPDKLAYCLVPLLDFRKKDVKNHKTKAKDFKIIFYKIGKLVYYSNRGDNLNNSRAKAILSQIEENAKLRLEFKVHLGEHKAKLDHLQKDYGALGIVNMHLKELQIDKNNQDVELDNAYKEYGKSIYEINKGIWEYSIPSSLESELNKVQQINNQIEYYNIQVKDYELQRKIEISENKIANYSEKLEYLEKQISNLEDSKKKLMDNIQGENAIIIENKIKETQLKQQAEGLK